MTINSIGGSSQGIGMMRPPQFQTFTEDQKSQVTSILSEYDSSSLTAEDASSINESFKEAGFKGGFGLYQAIKEAGFDGDTIRELDPTSQVEGPKGPPPPPPPPSGGGATGLNGEALAELQSILEQYDLENLSSEDESELLSALDESGLLMSGLLFNTSV